MLRTVPTSIWLTLALLVASPLPSYAVNAVAGPDQDVAERSAVTLDASASQATQGGTLSFVWRQTKGPDVALQQSGGPTATFTAPETGNSTNLQFEVAVTETTPDQPQGEQAARTDTDRVSISVFDVDRGGLPPIANAGPDLSVRSGDRVSLDGSGSSDPEGEKITYSWRQVDGPTVTLSDRSEVIAHFNAPIVFTPTTLTFQLTVSDGVNTVSDLVTVNVVLFGNRTPVANAGADRTDKAGATVVLDAAGSSDPDNDPLTFAWRQIGGPEVDLNTTAGPTVSFVAPAPKNEKKKTLITFQLTVSDGRGGEDQDEVTITILPADANAPPSADAGPDAEAVPGGTVRLDGSRSSDPENEAFTYHWEQVSGPTVTLQNPDSAVATFQAPASDSDLRLTFRLTVTNDSGTSSDEISVLVTRGAAPAPALTASVSNFSIFPNPFDPNAGPATFEYDLGADGAIEIHIYDLFGDGVRVLHANGTVGRNHLQWDGRNGEGDVVGNGGYVIQLEASDSSGNTVRKSGRLAVVK